MTLIDRIRRWWRPLPELPEILDSSRESATDRDKTSESLEPPVQIPRKQADPEPPASSTSPHDSSMSATDKPKTPKTTPKKTTRQAPRKRGGDDDAVAR